MEHGIVLSPEILGYFKNLPITNTLLVGWITIIILTVLSIVATRKVTVVPSGLQNLFELVLDFGYTTVSDLAGSQKAKVFFPDSYDIFPLYSGGKLAWTSAWFFNYNI